MKSTVSSVPFFDFAEYYHSRYSAVVVVVVGVVVVLVVEVEIATTVTSYNVN